MKKTFSCSYAVCVQRECLSVLDGQQQHISRAARLRYRLDPRNVILFPRHHYAILIDRLTLTSSWRERSKPCDAQ